MNKLLLLLPLLLISCGSDKTTGQFKIETEIDELLISKFEYEIGCIKETYVDSREVLIDRLKLLQIQHSENEAYSNSDGMILRSNQLTSFQLADKEQLALCAAYSCSGFKAFDRTHLSELSIELKKFDENDQTVEESIDKTKELVGLKTMLVELISFELKNRSKVTIPESVDLSSLINDRITLTLPELAIE